LFFLVAVCCVGFFLFAFTWPVWATKTVDSYK